MSVFTYSIDSTSVPPQNALIEFGPTNGPRLVPIQKYFPNIYVHFKLLCIYDHLCRCIDPKLSWDKGHLTSTNQFL